MVLLQRIMIVIDPIISDIQPGFRKRIYTQDNIHILVLTIQYLLSNREEEAKELGLIIYIDFVASNIHTS